MNDFRGNIDHWIRHAEPDYYIFFIKAWIPFNAWYVAELPRLNKRDTKIIQELQDNPNSKPRLFIENYLKSNKPDALRFKSHLAELHHLLETKTLTHNGVKLSFNNLSLSENPKKFDRAIDKTGNIYKTEFKTSFYEAIVIDKGGRTLMHFKQPEFSIEGLKKHNDYIKINNPRVQRKILECYSAIDPNKSISLVSNTKAKSDCITLYSINKVNFINDPTTIAKACIKVLYSLRCMLFHGEVEPTNSNISVYEHSYNILRLILKDLN